ncbi:MAG: DUF2961 domain-containing protein [bacterium]|nr:DUF2961 domain-containing protein [bacterium]
MSGWNGIGGGLGDLARLADARTRSITAENRTGAKGGGGRATEGVGAAAAADLGVGWKISPCDEIAAGATRVIAAIEGPGVIQHVWMTLTGAWRDSIVRIYWDGQEHPSVEVPAGDFFCMGWGCYAQVNAQPVNVNPGSGFNCFWPMPFQGGCRITLENRGTETLTAFYQIDYALCEVDADAAYFHAQFRRAGPVDPPGGPFVILDGVCGRGHYVGTYLAWAVHDQGWWGEGELKVYLDGDDAYPTLCGTGTEDYFGGSYNFEAEGEYTAFSAPYLGMPQVLRPDGLYQSQQRFGLYRFHVLDPIRFATDIRVDVQCLGWRDGAKRFLRRRDDIASTAFWYQTLPSTPFPPLPDRDALEVI